MDNRDLHHREHMFTQSFAKLAEVDVHITDVSPQQAGDLRWGQVDGVWTEVLCLSLVSLPWAIGWHPLKVTQEVVEGGLGASHWSSIAVNQLSGEVLRVAVSGRTGKVIINQSNFVWTAPFEMKQWSLDNVWMTSLIFTPLVTTQQRGGTMWPTFLCRISSSTARAAWSQLNALRDLYLCASYLKKINVCQTDQRNRWQLDSTCLYDLCLKESRCY